MTFVGEVVKLIIEEGVVDDVNEIEELDIQIDVTTNLLNHSIEHEIMICDDE